MKNIQDALESRLRYDWLGDHFYDFFSRNLNAVLDLKIEKFFDPTRFLFMALERAAEVNNTTPEAFRTIFPESWNR